MNEGTGTHRSRASNKTAAPDTMLSEEYHVSVLNQYK